MEGTLVLLIALMKFQTSSTILWKKKCFHCETFECCVRTIGAKSTPMRFLFLLFFTAICSSTFAQKTEAEHSVKLHTGEVFEGDKVLYINPILKQPSWELDGKKFETGIVAYIQNNHGFLANLNKIHGEKAERYALRIKKGKINLFEEVDIEFYGGETLEAEGDEKPETLASGEIYQYYSMGDGEVKKARFKSLKNDLKDNEASVKHLNAFRNFKILQATLIALGAGIITYDIINQSDDAVRFSPMMAAGIVVGGSSYFLQSKKDDALWLAADAYNKD
jgi:hypothetical protein